MRRFSVFILLLTSLTGFAQTTDLFEQYKEASAGAFPLFKGKIATKYNFSYNGVFTWDRNGFRAGDLMYAGKLYKGLQMDINAHLQTLLVYYPDNFTTVELEGPEVETFTLGNDVFRNLSARGIKVPKGFYKVIYEGKEAVYERIDKEFIRNINSANDGSIGYNDPNYKEGVFEQFVQHKTYYFIGADGKAERFNNPKFLIGRHKDKRKEIKKMLSEMGLSKADYDVMCRNIMNFVENGD